MLGVIHSSAKLQYAMFFSLKIPILTGFLKVFGPGGGLPHGSIRGRAALEDYVFHCFSIFEVFLGVSFSLFGICRVLFLSF